MPTYKNIRIKKRGGGTRLQRVQVLASGKYKFVKNLGGGAKPRKRKSTKAPTRRRRTTAKKKSYSSRGRAILGNLGAVGLAEDLAIGYFGAQVLGGMGYGLDQAMPMTRIVQGAIGKALNRRGKGRLAYGVIDLIDVYLIKRGAFKAIDLKAWM